MKIPSLKIRIYGDIFIIFSRYGILSYKYPINTLKGYNFMQPFYEELKEHV